MAASLQGPIRTWALWVWLRTSLPANCVSCLNIDDEDEDEGGGDDVDGAQTGLHAPTVGSGLIWLILFTSTQRTYNRIKSAAAEVSKMKRKKKY